MSNPTWEEMKADVAGKVYEDFDVCGVRCIIMRGPMAICAYLGVPENHPLAGVSYDDLDLDVHCGLSFSDKGDGVWRPEGYWWFGWDYGHHMDKPFHSYGANDPSANEWTIPLVKAQVIRAAFELHGKGGQHA